MNNIHGFIANIMPDQVVDRENYIDKIVSIFKNPLKSNIVIIMAGSAVGKSSLVDKLLDNKSIQQDKIRVRTLPINQSQKNEEWEFLGNIFSAVRKKYENTPDSFTGYIYSLKNKFVNKDMLYYVISTIYSNESLTKNKFINSFFFLSLLWFFKLGKFNIENLVDDNSINAYRIKAQYIKYILNHKKIVFSLDNIQNIDKNSFRELLNIVNETKSNNPQFIFEYTLSEEKSQKCCQELATIFETTSVETQIILLEKIESKYIVDVVSKHMLLPNRNWEFNVNLQRKYEQNDSGNIREMIDYGICFNESNNSYSESEEYSLENILNLPDFAKQLLSIIICSNNSISKELLEHFREDINLNIETAIQELSERLLIDENGPLINLSHASLGDVWFKNPQHFSVFDNISYNCLEKYYLNNIRKYGLEKTPLYDQSWINLINIYAKYKTENIVFLFKYIDIDCKNLISRENAWKYINKIIDITKSNNKEYYDLLVDIIRYCFESELYENGFQIVQDIEEQISTDILTLYHSMYLSALDKHNENIIFCQSILNKREINATLYYNIKLISLASYRSLHQLEDCYRIHEELTHDKKFRKMNEYAFFLRLCEMYLDRNKSLKFLRRSVKIFEKRGDYIQAGKSLISYAYILASQGKLKMAQQKIEKAERYLADKRMGFHMFLVNKAAISLYNGDYSEEVWETLNKSEITAVVPFDKLAIIVNKLVWCIENKNSNRHEMLIKQAIDLLEKEPDRHIHGLIYYNIYYLLKSRNMEDNTFYLKKAEEMAPYCKPVYARLKKAPTRETKFALKYNWHVCFLAYWTYDLINIDK